MIRIVENRFLNNDGGCNPDISENHYYECYRKFIESAIHSEKNATKYCENKLKDFGNCTVPQVIIFIFVVINLIHIFKIMHFFQVEYFSSSENMNVSICTSVETSECAEKIGFFTGRLINSDSNPCEKPCLTTDFYIAKTTLSYIPVDNSTFYA